MKLRTKIHLFTTLLMLILLLFINSGIYFLYKELAFNTEFKQLESRGDELLTTLKQITNETITDPNQVLRAFMPTNGAIYVLDEKGATVTSVVASLTLENSKLNVIKNERYTKSVTEDGLPVIQIETPAIWVDGSVVHIQMLQRLDDVATNMELLKLILIAVTVLFAIPILLSNMMLTRIILKPLHLLSETMKRSANSGTYEKIEHVDMGKDELAEISRTFNGMMEALETNYQKQKQFVSNASHELKTPLTVIESYAKLLVRRGFSNEKVAKEALEAIINESTRMNAMIVQMLELAKNKEQVVLNIEHVDVSKLLDDTLSQMRQAYNREFQLQSEGKLFAHTDVQKLKQLFFIILDNARKYSNDRIIIYTSTTNLNFITIRVQDFGVGILEEQLPHLFDRFYRVNQDRNRKTGGTGLGLAIAKELADLLEIEIQVESSLGVGTCFTLQVPIALTRLKEDTL